MRIGVPRETQPGERRVAATPESVSRLVAAGWEVVVEAGAGLGAELDDAAFQEAGAQVVDRATALGADVVLRICPMPAEEVPSLRRGAVLVSLVQPARNDALVQALASHGVRALALDQVPRITRAQKMDVLSSMANLVGYRAVVEAAAAFRGFFGGQITAAGRIPPARVLIIGAGVAGLAAIAAARALGAEVRAFDVRAAAREQVESLGATFLEVPVSESGDGAGGYAKVMSPEFIAAEMALFLEQAREVDVVITTALVPGRRAPILLTADHVAAMRPGSVIVDLAAEQGGNVVGTVPGERVVVGGVHILGYTDLASRMAGQASSLFAINLVNLLEDLGRTADGDLSLDPEDEVVRKALVTRDGRVSWPPPPDPAPPPVAPAAPTPAKAPPVPAQAATAPARAAHPPGGRSHAHAPVPSPPAPPSPARAVGTVALVAGLAAVGVWAPSELVQHLTVFVLACFVGWQVIWNVTAALHTPLMSVTNAISGVIVVGGLLQAGSGHLGVASVLGAVAIFFASINIFGGFLVTSRMLQMFRREGA